MGKNGSTRVIARGFIALLATGLVVGAVLMQISSDTRIDAAQPGVRTAYIHPLPNENLKAFEARMNAYFAPKIASQGLRSLIREEGGEYNQFIKFMRYWEPRLYPHGDFNVYFERERNFYRSRNVIRPGNVPGQQRPGGNRAGSTGASLLSVGGSWQEIGPISKPTSKVGVEGIGPIEFITFYNPSPSRMLCGSTAGGLFYSTNSGVTWSKTGTDTQIGRSGVGTAVFHPSNFQTWFAASAGNGGNNEPEAIGYTGGVFRTIDEGANWSQIGDQSLLGGVWSRIFKLAINPNNPNQLWAATSVGLFVTNNALAVSPSWAAVPALAGKYLYDFEIRPGNANWLYATVADWGSSGPTNMRFMYYNGTIWQNVSGQPASSAGASGLNIEVSPANADNLYCLIIPPGGSPSQLYIYDFGSNQWKLVFGSAYVTMGGGNGFGVDPVNPNEIFLSQGSEGRRYTYQGNPPYITYNSAYSGGGYHPDIEDLVPHPINTNEVWMSHHGGVAVSTDNGLTWADRSTGLGVAQVTRMATSASDPSYVALGLYHDGTIVTTSPWYNLWSPGWKAFPSSFCDGMRPMIDPTTPQYMWHSCQWGQWFRSTDDGVTFNSNSPPYSHDWTVEAVFNHLNPQTQFRLGEDNNGYRTVMRTPDRGNTWAQIDNFKALYPKSSYEYILWKLYTPETNGDYLLAHLLERPVNSNAWWKNHLYRTKIANANVIASWEELPLPVDGWIGDVDFDPVNPDILYIANDSSISSSSSLTGTGMIFKVDYTNAAAHTNYACTQDLCWDLTQNLPNTNLGEDSLAVEQGSNGGIYLATDFGVWYSNNSTRALGVNGWMPFGSSLPNTAYMGLEINYVNNKIRAASFGRGVWEADLMAGCVAPPSGLALWLPLDETAGTKALNAASTAPAFFPGTHVAGPIPTTGGKVTGALCFDGNDDRVDVPTYTAINISTGNLSLDVWVLRKSGATSTQEILIDKRASATPTARGYSLFLDNGVIGFQLADGNYSNYFSQDKVPVDGQWHHVAVTVDRGNHLGGRFYLDGKLAGPPFNPKGRPGSLSNAAPFRIGARAALGLSTVSGALKGCLDEVEAFRRVLSPDEVLSIYRAGAKGKCKQSFGVSQLASFCDGANDVTVSVPICNYQSSSQVFNYSFQGLPVQNGCSLPGPVSFTPASGTITVQPGKCMAVQTLIGKPTALTTPGPTACYQMLIQMPATQETFSYGAAVDVRQKCGEIIHK